jgi:hypothetical protein
MVQDEPEQYIAEVEHHIAGQEPVTDLPPESADRAAESRRFVATSPRMQTWLFICTFGFFAALVAVFAVMFVFSSAYITGWVVLGLITVGLILFGVVAVRRWGWSRKIPVCITSDGLTVEDRPGEVFSFEDARLGLFTFGQDATMSGTALHLRCGSRRFVLGGRDHRLGTATPLQASPTGRVDGWLQAAEFDEVLSMVARRSGLEVRGPAPGEPLRCLLYPPPKPLGPFAPFVSERRHQPPQPRLAIEGLADAIRVVDPNTNAVIASASRAQVTVTPANYRHVDPEQSHNVPVLVVHVPGLQPLTIQCHRAWRGDVPKEKTKPEFRVSAADSRALVEEFGLAANLKP